VPTPDKLPVSLVVIAQDEEDHIGDCLRSADFCAEAVVLDGGSRDRTREIAAALGARVETRPFDDFVTQKGAAVDLARHDWVLCLDADERVSPELAAEIRDLFAAGEPPCDGYSMPRLSWHLGRWIRGGGWYPDRKLRLFRRSRGRWAGRNPHDKVVCDGAVGRLRGDLLHHPYRDLAHHLRKMDRYTELAAATLLAEGRGLATLRMFVVPPLAFLRSYLLRRGFRDGRAGLVLAALEARYEFLRYRHLRRLRRASRRDSTMRA